MQRALAGQHPRHLFPTALRHLGHRRCGVVGGMRRQNDVLQARQRIVGRRGFVFLDVERRASDPLLL